MAISVWKSATAIMKELGVHQADLNWLKANDISVKLMPQKFLFVWNAVPGGVAVAEVPVTVSQLHKIHTGDLPPPAGFSLMNKLNAAIDGMQEDMLATGALPGVVSSGTVTGALDLLPKKAAVQHVNPAHDVPIPAVSTPAPVPAPDSLVFDVSKMKTAPRVKLAVATKLYQPVLGTSGDSRYYVVGITSDLKIAVRIQGEGMSVRIEGEGLLKHKNLLKTVGFDPKAGGNGYTSLHLTIPDKVLMRKALGSILLGLGLKYLTPMPELSVIE